MIHRGSHELYTLIIKWNEKTKHDNNNTAGGREASKMFESILIALKVDE